MNKRHYKKHWCNKKGCKTYAKLQWHIDFKNHLDSLQKHMDSLGSLFSEI